MDTGNTFLIAFSVFFFFVRETKGRQICFDDLGCFSMSSPWISLLRPFPPPISPSEMEPKVRLYTRASRKGKIIKLWPKTSPSINQTDFNITKPATVLIVHGFATNGKVMWMKALKDLYLMQVDANVFLLDWGNGSSRHNYFQVASNTRVVGSILGRFCKELLEVGLDFNKVHMIGHSLGAHISAYAAKKLGKNIKPGRITGLDPAQPGFEATPTSVRLSPDDAVFVDAVHTDARPFIPFFGLGIMQPVGHVDFYVNGGSGQPNCITNSVPKISSIYDIVSLPVELIKKYFTCSHMRSYKVFMWSLVNNTNCMIMGRKMPFAETFLKITTLGYLSLADPIIDRLNECTPETCTVMGLKTPFMKARGTFSVTTNADPPYCESFSNQDMERINSSIGGVLGLAGSAYETLLYQANSITNTINSTIYSYLSQAYNSSFNSDIASFQ